MPLLGRLPLDIRIRREADSGVPTVASDPDGPIAARYVDLARRLSARLSVCPEDHKAAFPEIVVEDK